MMTKRNLGRLATFVASVIVSVALVGCAPKPAPAPKPDFTRVPEVIAVVGDFGSGRAAELRVSKMVASFDPSIVVTAGDNVYLKKGYNQLVKKYYPQTLVPATGNHDYLLGIAKFDKFFGIDENSRSYVYRAQSGVEFFMLDSTAGLSSKATLEAQREWLIKELAQSEATFKVVVLHHPPYSSAKHGNTKRYQWAYADLGADLVISGHDHTYERIIRRGGTYVVDGAGGAKLYKCKKLVYGSLGCDDKHYGALFLYANSTQLRGVFRSTSGQTLDTFTLNR
jgi:predicted phosphodiesterase